MKAFSFSNLENIFFIRLSIILKKDPTLSSMYTSIHNQDYLIRTYRKEFVLINLCIVSYYLSMLLHQSLDEIVGLNSDNAKRYKSLFMKRYMMNLSLNNYAQMRSCLLTQTQTSKVLTRVLAIFYTFLTRYVNKLFQESLRKFLQQKFRQINPVS